METRFGSPTTQSPQFAGCHQFAAGNVGTAIFLPNTNASFAGEVQTKVPWEAIGIQLAMRAF